MNILGKFVKLLLLAILLSIFAGVLIIIYLHWFLPDQMYEAISYSEIINNELKWGLGNILLEVLLMGLPLTFIILLNGKSEKISFKRILFIIFLIALISTYSRIAISLRIWQPLIESSKSMKDHKFMIGRTSGIFAESVDYKFTALVDANNYSFVQRDVLPAFKKYGYGIREFNFSISDIDYKGDISLVPFYTQLQDGDRSYVSFVKGEPLSGYSYSTRYYEDQGVIKVEFD